MKSRPEIIREHLVDDFEKIIYGSFEVLVRKKDGYINATKLCKEGGKDFSHWKVNKGTKQLLEEFKLEWNCIPLDLLMAGNNSTRGTYVHPDLIVHVAIWISPRFGLYVSRIVKEWNTSVQNRTEFWTEMGTCIQNFATTSGVDEEIWKREIALKERGQMEVETKYGFVDVLTPTKIIEVKEACNWKHAFGQILAYSEAFPSHIRCIYLFNGDKLDPTSIQAVCARFQVEVTFLHS